MPDEATASALPHIETIVVIMFENRSFDTMLGWLYPDSPPSGFDGIPPHATNRAHRWPYAPQHGFPELGLQRWRVPRQDPFEGMPSVHRQMYGQDSTMPVDPGWGDDAKMQGFAIDYSRTFPAPARRRRGDGGVHER